MQAIRTFHIEIDLEACKGCGLCVPVCPKNVIQIGENFNSKGWLYAEPVREEDCTGCRQCAMICPDVAIRIIRED